MSGRDKGFPAVYRDLTWYRTNVPCMQACPVAGLFGVISLMAWGVIPVLVAMRVFNRQSV